MTSLHFSHSRVRESKTVSPLMMRRDRYATRLNVHDIIVQLVYTLIVFVNAFLVLRFIFTAASVGNANSLTRFVTSATDSLVQPFFDLFSSSIAYGSGQIEFETLMAIAVYSLIARAIIRLVEQSSNSNQDLPIRKVQK